LDSNRDAISGKRPPGPSIVGSKPNVSGAFLRAFKTPEKISDVLAALRQLKVFPDVAREVHEGTPDTKFCQSISRREALNSNAVAAEPDSNIYFDMVSSSTLRICRVIGIGSNDGK